MQMFKRLQMRLLVLNMFLISILMIGAFVTIYIITANQVARSIDLEFSQLPDYHRRSDRSYPRGDVQPAQSEDGSEPKVFPAPDTYLPERSISFTIITEGTGAVSTILSFFDARQDFYPQALETALAQGSAKGRFELGGQLWEFRTKQLQEGLVYDFLDIGAQQAVLDRLIITFILVALIALVVIFFISYFMTRNSIAPVRHVFEKQSQFISNASHELKTPLSVIISNSELLLAGGDEQTQKWARAIRFQTGGMADLLNDMLELASLEEWKSDEGRSELFNLSSCIEGSVLSAEGHVFEKHRRLEYDVEADIQYRGSVSNVNRILANLLDNAVKYSFEDSVIRLQLRRQGRKAVLRLSNRGPGIQAEDIENIFDRFYRADKSRSRKHSSFGLGLSITKALVDAEKAQIHCTSVPGQQTEFTVRFRL